MKTVKSESSVRTLSRALSILKAFTWEAREMNLTEILRKNFTGEVDDAAAAHGAGRRRVHL